MDTRKITLAAVAVYCLAVPAQKPKTFAWRSDLGACDRNSAYSVKYGRDGGWRCIGEEGIPYHWKKLSFEEAAADYRAKGPHPYDNWPEELPKAQRVVPPGQIDSPDPKKMQPHPMLLSPIVMYLENGHPYLHCPDGYAMTGTNPQWCEDITFLSESATAPKRDTRPRKPPPKA